MAAPVLQLKRSTTPGSVPTTTQLLPGELAVNVGDGKLFLKKISSGVESIVDITNPSFLSTYPGTVQFGGTSGLQGTLDFFWDNTNLRLGLRTNANPVATLDVGAGDINISSTTRIKISDSYGSANKFLKNTSTGTEWSEPTRIIDGDSSVEIDDASGTITSTINGVVVQEIDSSGVTVTGTLTADNVTAINNVTADEFYQATTQGTVNYTSKMIAMMIATGL